MTSPELEAIHHSINVLDATICRIDDIICGSLHTKLDTLQSSVDGLHKKLDKILERLPANPDEGDND